MLFSQYGNGYIIIHAWRMVVQIRIILPDGLYISRITLLLVSLDWSCAEKEKNRLNVKKKCNKNSEAIALAFYSIQLWWTNYLK